MRGYSADASLHGLEDGWTSRQPSYFTPWNFINFYNPRSHLWWNGGTADSVLAGRKYPLIYKSMSTVQGTKRPNPPYTTPSKWSQGSIHLLMYFDLCTRKEWKRERYDFNVPRAAYRHAYGRIGTHWNSLVAIRSFTLLLNLRSSPLMMLVDTEQHTRTHTPQ